MGSNSKIAGRMREGRRRGAEEGLRCEGTAPPQMENWLEVQQKKLLSKLYSKFRWRRCYLNALQSFLSSIKSTHVSGRWSVALRLSVCLSRVHLLNISECRRHLFKFIGHLMQGMSNWDSQVSWVNDVSSSSFSAFLHKKGWRRVVSISSDHDLPLLQPLQIWMTTRCKFGKNPLKRSKCSNVAWI